MLKFRPLTTLAVHLESLTKDRLWLQVIIGLFLGAAVGMLLNPSAGLVSENFGAWIANWLELPGQVFMRLVQMVMIPLIFASIISGIVSNSADNLKSFGLWLLLYFIFTTTVAILLGLLVALFFKPGEYVLSLGGLPNSDAAVLPNTDSVNLFDNIPSAISSLIPNNPMESILAGEMLGVVIFTIIIGVAITQLRESTAQPLIRFTEAIQKICMIVVSWAMKLVPFAVFGLMGALISRIGIEIFLGLGYYMIVVIAGLLLLMAFYMLIVLFVAKRNPIHFLRLIREPQLLAFSTASSAAVMPLSMKTANEKLKISPNVSDFVIPIGATINMDGTALFQF